MNQLDIIWVSLPFTDCKEAKVRPAVVVSNDEYNKSHSDIIVCAITTNLQTKEYSVIIDNENISSGNLPLKSRIRADKILQINKSLSKGTFASINQSTFKALTKEILKLISR